MKLFVVAVGQRMPDWAQTAYDDYAKRFPPDCRVEVKTVKTEPRGSKTLETLWRPSARASKPPSPRAPGWWHLTSVAPQ
jgi:23S rRNA pseudoU1915 N3-methylase RlmH